MIINHSLSYLLVPHAHSITDARSVHRSAIILGIIGVQEPESLSKSIKKHVAESLVSLLLDGKRNIFRLAAVELIGRGYGIWSPFIHGASIFKLLHSWLIQLYGGDEQFYQTTLKALIHILTTPETTGNTRNNSTITADSASTLSASSTASVSRKSSGSNLLASPLITWLSELHGSSREISQIERKCSIELIKSLLSFKPIVFQGHENLLVEVVMKLDLTIVSLFADLDSHFGVLSIHQPSQRLAVAMPDNSIAVYDLKNGTRITLLQGHVHPCTLVAFNPNKPDGKQLLSYSVNEACVRWWSTSGSSTSAGSSISGLFSSLTVSTPSPTIQSNSDLSNRPGIKPVKVVIVQPELTGAIDCIPSGSVFKLNPINLNWDVKSKSVEFRVGNLLTQTFNVPN